MKGASLEEKMFMFMYCMKVITLKRRSSAGFAIKALHQPNPLKSEDLNKVWLTHQQCMIKCMEERGSNKYKLPHMRKGALEREGLLPTSLHIPIELVRQTQALVDAADYEN